MTSLERLGRIRVPSPPERLGQVTPVHVYSSADEAELFLNGRSLGIRRTDHAGLVAPRAKNLLVFSVYAPARIAAVDNGDPTSLEPFQATECKAFNGLALVVVRTAPRRTGKIILRVEAEGLRGSEISLRASATVSQVAIV